MKTRLPAYASGLTPIVDKFVSNYVTLGGKGHGGDAYLLAGGKCTPASAKAIASKLLKQPAVIEAIKREADRSFVELVPLALSRLKQILTTGKDDTALRAVDMALNRAGMIVATQSQHTVTVQHDLSPAELRQDIARLLQEISPEARAALVQQGLLSAHGSDQAIDVPFETVGPPAPSKNDDPPPAISEDDEPAPADLQPEAADEPVPADEDATFTEADLELEEWDR